MQGLTLVGVLAIGVDATAAGRLDGILLAGVALLAFAAFEATLPLGDAARRLAACAGAADRIEEVLDATPPVRDPDTPVGLPATGTLVVADVTVVPPGSSDPRARRGVARRRPRRPGRDRGPQRLGQDLARPGAGALRRPGAGNGLPRRCGPPSRAPDRRAPAIRLVSQEAHLFTTSLRQNLALGRPDASEQQLVTALERAGLGGWLATLPLGLDTMLGEEGTAVSGGQRRRIALARGLLSDSRYLVLDEPTAHLDAGGARELLHRLGTDRRDRRGILVIAHTYTGLEAFNEIVVLDGGRVVERGTHQQLLAADGPYAALVSGGTPA